MTKQHKKKMKDATVYVSTAKSESGDDYGAMVFAKKPTDKAHEAIWREICPQEFPDNDDPENRGPGNWGSYLYVRLEKAKVI